MTRYKTVLIPFPFDDLTSSKMRPAVCLTDPIGPYRHVVVAFITSRVPAALLASDFLIGTRQQDFAITGLRVTSVLRLHRLVTLTTNLIDRELGQLPESMRREVEARLRALFAL